MVQLHSLRLAGLLGFVTLAALLTRLALANPDPPPPCNPCHCVVEVAPSGTITFTNVWVSETTICVGNSIYAYPEAQETSSETRVKYYCENATPNCPPYWVTNTAYPYYVTNWFVVSGPGNYSDTGGGYGPFGIIATPTNSGSGSITFSAVWKNYHPCTYEPMGGGTTSESINFTVVGVGSLTASPGSLVGKTTNEYNNVVTDIYVVPWVKPVSGTPGPFVSVTAESDPPSLLPDCWVLLKGPSENSLVNVPQDNGETRKLALIDRSVPASTLVVCQAGTSEKRVLVHVVKVNMDNVYTSQTLDPDVLVDTERVAVETKLNATISPSLGAPLTVAYDWTIGGSKIKTYNHDIDEASKHNPVALSPTTVQEISFFWQAEGNPIAVKAKATITGSAGGGGASVDTTVNFNVIHDGYTDGVGAYIKDPNRMVYCANGDPRRNPSGLTAYPVYQALQSHQNWHTGGPDNGGPGALMDNGEIPVKSASEGTWGNRGRVSNGSGGWILDSGDFLVNYNGSAFLEWHRELIDAWIAWRDEFNVDSIATIPGLGVLPPNAPVRPEYLKETPANASTSRSRLYAYRRLGEFQTLDELGRDVVMPWHNQGHVAIAADPKYADMNSEFDALQTPDHVFWRWHTEVDKVRSEWATDKASVSSVVPSHDSTVSAAPSQLIVKFSKKVSLRSDAAANTIGIAPANFSFKTNGVALPSSVTVSEDSAAANRFTEFKIASLPSFGSGTVIVQVIMTGTASFDSKTWSFTISP
jgi:hypothetical protein